MDVDAPTVVTGGATLGAAIIWYVANRLKKGDIGAGAKSTEFVVVLALMATLSAMFWHMKLDSEKGMAVSWPGAILAVGGWISTSAAACCYMVVRGKDKRARQAP